MGQKSEGPDSRSQKALTAKRSASRLAGGISPHLCTHRDLDSADDTRR